MPHPTQSYPSARKAGRKVLFGRCEMAEEYTDSGTSLAGGREGRREAQEAAFLGGLPLGPLEMGFWNLKAGTLKSDLLAPVGPWRLENGKWGWKGLDQQRILSPKRIEQETPPCRSETEGHKQRP